MCFLEWILIGRKGDWCNLCAPSLPCRYYDGQSNDSRLNSIINRTAVENGAVSVNYMEVMSLLHSPCPNHTQSPHEIVTGVHVRDTLTGNEIDIRGKVTVNATGPFADSIIKMYEALSPSPVRHVDCIVPSKGVHLLLQGSLCPRQAGIITTTSDNRVMFMLPWQN